MTAARDREGVGVTVAARSDSLACALGLHTLTWLGPETGTERIVSRTPIPGTRKFALVVHKDEGLVCDRCGHVEVQTKYVVTRVEG